MNWLERNFPWVMLALAVLLAPVIVGFLAASVVALLAGVVGGASVGALLADAVVVVGVTAFMVVAEIALAVSFVVSIVRRASFPTSERLAALFSHLELFFPPLRDLALSQRFEPSLEERERAIKRRYVDGELSEDEFEREMRDLLADAEPDPALTDHPDPLDSIDSIDAGGERVEESPATDAVPSEMRGDFERE